MIAGWSSCLPVLTLMWVVSVWIHCSFLHYPYSGWLDLQWNHYNWVSKKCISYHKEMCKPADSIYTSVWQICKSLLLKSGKVPVTRYFYKMLKYGQTVALWQAAENLWHESQSGDRCCILVKNVRTLGSRARVKHSPALSYKEWIIQIAFKCIKHV